MRKRKTILFFLCLLSMILVVVDFSITDQAEIDKLKKEIEDLKKLVNQLAGENKALKEKIAELEKKVTKIENERETEREGKGLMNFIQNIPYVGDAVNYVYGVIGPSEYCSNGCGTRLWNSYDHRQSCRNKGHSNGVHYYWDCANVNAWFCPREGEHVSPYSP